MCSSYEGIESSIEKAGYTWEYIQFLLKDSQEKYLLIVKNSRGINKAFNGNVKKSNQKNYLYEYAGINNPLASKGDLESTQVDRKIQLELSLPELDAIQKNIVLHAPEGYNRFYVITYEFDNMSKMISKITLTLPNQQDMLLVEVADLTYLIESSEILISDEELQIVQSDKVPDSMYSSDDQLFDYGIAADEEQENF